MSLHFLHAWHLNGNKFSAELFTNWSADFHVNFDKDHRINSADVVNIMLKSKSEPSLQDAGKSKSVKIALSCDGDNSRNALWSR